VRVVGDDDVVALVGDVSVVCEVRTVWEEVTGGTRVDTNVGV
jgi:hypothetical protein